MAARWENHRGGFFILYEGRYIMQELRIDSELKKLIPPLTLEEYKQLEENIIAEGCRDALVVWGGVIVDGHNRYEICKKNGIEFKKMDKQFESMDAVKVWIINNQKGRRNLTDGWKFELAQEKKRLLTDKGREKLKEAGKEGRNIQLGGLSLSDKGPEHDTRKEIAADLGWSTGKTAQADYVWKHGDEAVKEKVKAGEETVKGAYNAVKKEKRKEERTEILKEKPLPKNKYHVIYCDPPWEYKNSGFAMSAENQYPTMSTEKLKNMPVAELGNDNSVMFMWATNPLLKDALEVMKAWGYEYKTNIVWIKSHHTAGFYVFGKHELLLIGVRGSMLPTGEKNKSIIEGENTKHSKKPEVTYEIIESMYPKLKYIELFARNTKQGWESWGNEL